jgi:hypothetical protein
MTECAVCGEKVVAAGEKLCSFCRYHAFADELLYGPELSRIRSELGKALRWQFYRQQQQLLRSIADAEQLIGWFYAQDLQEVQEKVIEALAGGDRPEVRASEDPWGVEVLYPLTKIIGAPLESVRAFVEDLRARGAIRIECSEAGPPAVGMKPFPRLRCWWVKCDPKDAQPGP